LFKENFTERQTEINPEGAGTSKTWGSLRTMPNIDWAPQTTQRTVKSKWKLWWMEPLESNWWLNTQLHRLRGKPKEARIENKTTERCLELYMFQIFNWVEGFLTLSQSKVLRHNQNKTQKISRMIKSKIKNPKNVNIQGKKLSIATISMK
jgi:hypothetical protein